MYPIELTAARKPVVTTYVLHSGKPLLEISAWVDCNVSSAGGLYSVSTFRVKLFEMLMLVMLRC